MLFLSWMFVCRFRWGSRLLPKRDCFFSQFFVEDLHSSRQTCSLLSCVNWPSNSSYMDIHHLWPWFQHLSQVYNFLDPFPPCQNNVLQFEPFLHHLFSYNLRCSKTIGSHPCIYNISTSWQFSPTALKCKDSFIV